MLENKWISLYIPLLLFFFKKARQEIWFLFEIHSRTKKGAQLDIRNIITARRIYAACSIHLKTHIHLVWFINFDKSSNFLVFPGIFNYFQFFLVFFVNSLFAMGIFIQDFFFKTINRMIFGEMAPNLLLILSISCNISHKHSGI